MTIGTGIFLGSLLLGLIWLYVATWQRWRWKRITTWGLCILVLPVAGFGAWIWLNSWWASYPRLEETLWDLKPGMTTNDVLFRKGEPSSKEPHVWLYFEDSKRTLGYAVMVQEHRVRSIMAFTSEGNEYRLPTIQGISNYSSQEDIEQRFGNPDYVSIHKDQTRRLLNYNQFGLVFTLAKNRVTSLGVFDRQKPLRYVDEVGKAAATKTRQ